MADNSSISIESTDVSFGHSVAIHNNYIAVGAPKQDTSGAIHVYKLNNNEWEDMSKITPDTSMSSNFGHSIDIHDNQIVVGAPLSDNSGSVYIYEISNNGWKKKSFINETESNMFGNSVALNDKYVSIGAPKQDTSGVLYVYLNEYSEYFYLQDVSTIDCGKDFATVVANNKCLYSWGSNISKKLSERNLNTHPGRPSKIKDLSNIVDVKCGDDFTIAKDVNNNLYSWGDNALGQLGNRTHGNAYSNAEKIENIVVNNYTLGAKFALAIVTEGKIISWGIK